MQTMYGVMSSVINLNVNHNELIYRLNTTDQSLAKETHILVPLGDCKFNGFFKYVANTLKDTSANNQIFELTSSPEHTVDKIVHSVSNLLNDTEDSLFISQGQNDEYIQLKLLKGTLQLTHYSMMSSTDANKGTCPESWIVEGSTDSETWMEIDNVQHDRSLQAQSAIQLFKVNSICPPFKYIRIKQIDTCHPKNKRFVLARLELFGYYQEDQ